MEKSNDITCYGEWVPIINEEEKEEATTYLKSAKKFMLRKIPDYIEQGEDQFVYLKDVGRWYGTVAIKYMVKKINVNPDLHGK